MHSDLAVRRDDALYRPRGHRNCVAVRVDAGQYEPAGHDDGVDVAGPQKNPEGHVAHADMPCTGE